MKKFDQKCVICGIDLDGQDETFDEFSSESNTSLHDLKVLLSWKKDCATSLCQILFQSDENVCLPYFQNGDYCSQCLQIVRDVDFNLKQLIKCKRQIKRSSRRLCTLLKTNFNCITKILTESSQSVSGVNEQFCKEVVERIQLVVSNRSKHCERSNSISETDCYQEYATKLKEENLDWETELEESSAQNEFLNTDTDECINSDNVPKLKQSKEIGKPGERTGTIETEVTYEDFVNIFRNTKACDVQISQCFTKIESDLQAELSEHQKTSLKTVIKGIKTGYSAKWKKHRRFWERFKNDEKNWLNRKVKVKVDNPPIPPEINRKPCIVKNERQKFRNVAHLTVSGVEDSSDKCDSELSDDSDWQLPPHKEIRFVNFTNTKIKEQNLDWEPDLEESSVVNEFHYNDADEYINSGDGPKKPQSKCSFNRTNYCEDKKKTIFETCSIKKYVTQRKEETPVLENDSEDELYRTNEDCLSEGLNDASRSNENINSCSDTENEVAQEQWSVQGKSSRRHNNMVKRPKRELKTKNKNKSSSEDEDSSDKYESGLSDDSDWLPPHREIGLVNFTSTKLKQKITEDSKESKCRIKIKNEYSKSRIYRKTIQAIRTPLILEESEMAILKHICANKVMKLNRLNDTEMAVAAKIARYTKKAIFKSNLSKNVKNAAFQLKNKFCKRICQKRVRPPKQEICIYHCKEENCDASYVVEEKLEGHIRGVHLGESLPYYCTSCPTKFTQYDCMKKHRLKVHQGVKLNNHCFCDICHKGYKTQEELNTHSENAHRGPNPFACAFCETQCSTSKFLIRHTNESHSGISPQQLESIKKLTCEKCGRLCASEPALRRHYFHKHKNETEKSVNKDQSFNCEQCDKTFASKDRFNSHTNSVHSKVICEECGKSYSKSSFRLHQLRHTRVLKYKCKICGKQYISSQQLKDHERVHSGVRAFVCSVCGKRFLTSTVLHGHEKTHEPGYIPRKPFRRNRQNRKKKLEHSEQLLQPVIGASQLSPDRNNEHPSVAIQSTFVINSEDSQWTPFLILQSDAFVNQM